MFLTSATHMRGFLTAAVLAAALQAGTAWAAEEPPFLGMVVAQEADLRAGQNKAFEKVGVVRKDQPLTVVAESYGWYKVQLPVDARSYVAANYIRDVGGDLAEVTGNRLNIRSAPTVQATVLGQLKKGELVRVLEQKDGWARVEPADRSFGWLPAEVVAYKSKDIPPPRVLTRSSPSAKPQDTALQKPSPDKDTVSGTGILQDLADKAVSPEIRHRLAADGQTVYFLKGYRRVLDGFLNQKVDIQGTRQHDVSADQPVLLVNKITLVL